LIASPESSRRPSCGRTCGRSGSWEARYRDPSGRQRTKTFPTKADARAFLEAVEVDKRRGAYADPALGRTTFGEYAAAWLNTKADVSARTRINVEGRLRNHILPEFESVPLARIQPSDVRAFIASLTADGLAPSTVKGVYLTLAQVLRTAAVDGYVARSPCIDVNLPSDRSREEMLFLEPGQVDALADAIDDRYRALVYLAAYGGLRAGELAALKVNRVNLLARTVEVVESASEVRGRLSIGPTKTGRVRTIAMPRFLADMLGEHVGRYPSADGFVFTAAKGGPLRWRNFYDRHFRPAVRRAGLPRGFRAHSLRHTCAALLIANGRHMEEVKDHLGHSSIRVTSDRYGHLFPRARQELADGLDETYRNAATAGGADVRPLRRKGLR
jgi:integrase